MEFRFWLQERLNHLGWSGAELARRLGVSPAAVNKWVNGKAKPARTQVRALASVLDVSADEIWGRVEGRNAPADVAELVARELPPSMTPDDARLVGFLLGAIVRALQEWNRVEAERDAVLLGETDGSAGGGEQEGGRVRPV